MDRREFLGGISALFASGLVIDEAQAEGPPPTAPDDVEPWLAKLDQDLQRMQAQRPTDGVRDALREAGLPQTLMGETFATMSLFAAWRESDEEVRQHPAFQARLLRSAEALARRTALMAAWIEGVDRARRRQIGALLARPNRLMAVLDHVLIRKGERMNPARRRALRGTLGDLARATRKAGAKPEALLDELILFVDHAAREEGVDRHALAAQERAAQERGEPTSATVETDEEILVLDEEDEGPNAQIRMGLRLLGKGVAMTGGGVLVFLLAVGTFGLPPLFAGLVTSVACLFLGPMLILTGLAMVTAGWAARRAQANEAEPEDEALLYLLSPLDPLSPQPA